MKKLVPLLLLMTCCSALAEWTKVAANARAEFFINFETLREQGDTVRVWVLINDVEKGTSLKNLEERDCKNNQWRIIQSIAYSKHFGEGEPVRSGTVNEKESWREIAAESIAATKQKIICEK